MPKKIEKLFRNAIRFVKYRLLWRFFRARAMRNMKGGLHDLCLGAMYRTRNNAVRMDDIVVFNVVRLTIDTVDECFEGVERILKEQLTESLNEHICKSL